MTAKNKQKAFSVLEMAISITIIAMLVSVVVAGQSVKHKLELNQVIDDISSITTAVQEFENTYGDTPGDIYDAEDKFGAAATNNGDGDGTLETTPAEETLFWQHLSLAGLIEGTYNGSSEEMAGPMKYSFYHAQTTSGLLNIQVGKASSGSLFSTKEAFDYDSKYDDGDPETGAIRAQDGAGETATDCVSGSSPNLSYNLTNNTENPCVINFFIEQ